MSEFEPFPATDNAALQRDVRKLLAEFPEPSRSRMRMKFRHDRAAMQRQRTNQTAAAVQHTYHEFVMGHHLQQLGFRPEYSRRIGGKTPDWFDERSRLIVEVFTCESVTAEPASVRMAARIGKKMNTYGPLAREHGLGLVLAVCTDDRLPSIEQHRVDPAMLPFAEHPDLSGVLLFARDSKQPNESNFACTFLHNPVASRPVRVLV